MRFIITTHAHLPGVGLSSPGNFGGLRFPDDDAAIAYARQWARCSNVEIERERGKARPGS